jgi:hypothetical protein
MIIVWQGGQYLPQALVWTNQIIIVDNDNRSYSIDGVNWQDSNVFMNLAPGIYTVYVKDTSGAIVDLGSVKIELPVIIPVKDAIDFYPSQDSIIFKMTDETVNFSVDPDKVYFKITEDLVNSKIKDEKIIFKTS